MMSWKLWIPSYAWISLLHNRSLEIVFYLGTQEKSNEGGVGWLKHCERYKECNLASI